MSLSENIRLLRKAASLTQDQFADIIGVKRTSVTNYEKGLSKPELDTLVKLCDYFNVNMNDIVRGSITDEKGNLKGNLTGNLLTKKTAPKTTPISTPNVEESGVKPVMVTVDETGNDNIVMVDTKAAAGYPQHYAEPGYFKDLPAFKLPGTEFRNATFRCFQVEGDSMGDTIYSNDWVIGRYMDGHYNEVKGGYIHVIVTQDSVMVKRVLNHVKEQGVLTLLSDNEAYQPYDVPVEDVLEIWFVSAKLSFNLPARKDYKAMLVEVQGEILDIRRRLLSLEKGTKRK